MLDKNKNSYVVLITSAVHASYGVYSPAERIAQTHDTVKSVKKYIPNSTIVLIDASKPTVANDDSDELNALIDDVDYFLDHSDDTDIQHFHTHVTNWDIGKNSMESLSFIKTLRHILNDPEMFKLVKDASRVFKISGRYKLNDSFNIKDWDNLYTKGKYVFKRAEKSWIPQFDTGVNVQYQTRLWSFDSIQFNDVCQLFTDIINNMFTTFNNTKYIDLEHSMAKFVPADKLIQLDHVGLEGNIAPNGRFISE